MWQDCFFKKSKLRAASKQSTSIFHLFLTILLSSENRRISCLFKKWPENEQLKAHSCQQNPFYLLLPWSLGDILNSTSSSLFILNPRFYWDYIPMYTYTFAGLGSCYLKLLCYRFVFPTAVTKNVLIITHQCQKVGNYEILSLKIIFFYLGLICINFNSEK